MLPPPESIGDQADRIRKAIPPLLKRGLVSEIETKAQGAVWREDGVRRVGVVITNAGRTLIAAEEAEPPVEPPVQPAMPQPHQPTKAAQVIALLQRQDGATLAELVAATGWLPHTTRAALTGLRKKGHVLAKSKRDDATCYRIEAAA